MPRAGRDFLVIMPLAALAIIRGIWAFITGSTWEASQLAPPQLLLGQKAAAFGTGYIGLGCFLFGCWVFFSLGWRGAGGAMIAIAVAITAAGFWMAL